MKTPFLLAWALALGLLNPAFGQPVPPAEEENPEIEERGEAAPAEVPSGDEDDQPSEASRGDAPAVDNWGSTPPSAETSRSSRAPQQRSTRAQTLTPPPASGDGEAGLRLNFRGVPLDMVLNYLSDAAGFVIILEADIRDARVDVWSNQPLSREEGIELLDTVLKSHGYAALRNGRTLTIVSLEEAKKRDVPVIAGGDPTAIPRSDRVVTQVIPVKFINATQLVKDLQPLLPATASLSANEGGNALVITDSQSNIRRMAEIVSALDTAIASVSTVRVFQLRYADAKSTATMLTSLFQSQDTNSRNNQGGPGRFFNQFRRDGNAGGGA